MAAVRNGITLTALCKEYRLGKTTVRALRNIDLEIKSGSFTCVAGPSGSGKTTLLNMIGLIDAPTSGTVHVAGEDIQGLPEKLRTRYRSRTLGFIFQSFNLLPVLDVFENVHLPLILHRELSPSAKRERVLEIVEAVGLGEHIRHKPFELSGGQRQRVAIARALVTHPLIVLADEPTANLDSETGAEVLALMEGINRDRGTTFIFSSHDPRVMERAAARFRRVGARNAMDFTIAKRICAIVIAAAFCLPLAAESFPEGDPLAYIDAVDSVMLPVNCKARMAVVDTYSTGTDRSSEGFFVRKNNKVVWVATAPGSQKNFALLRSEDVFYERFATTNKVVKTSATASSRGGETSNLDLTRFNTNLDYAARYIGEESLDGKACYRFELRAKNRKLAYSLVHLWVDKATRMPVKKAFFAVSEKVLKYYTVTQSTMKDGRAAEVQMEYVDALKPEDRSRIRLFDVTPLTTVPDQFFTKEYLESGRLFPYDF